MSNSHQQFLGERSIWIGLVMIFLGLSGVFGLDLYTEYSTVYAHEREHLAQAAETVHANLSRRLQNTSNALDSIKTALPWLQREQVEHDDEQLINRYLAAMVATQMGVRTLVVVDAEGTVTASNHHELVGQNFRDGDRYKTISRGADAAMLYVSAPFVTPLRTYATSLGRAMLDSRGQFTGYLLAVLDPDYFGALLNSVLYAPDIHSSLIHHDGKVVFRVPDSAGVMGMGMDLGQNPQSLYWRHVRSGQQRSLLDDITPTTGQEVVVAFRSIKPMSSPIDKPLVISVSRSRSAIVAPWRKEMTVRVMLFGSTALVTLVGLFVYLRRKAAYARLQAIQQNERVQAELQVRDSEQRFRDLFAHLPVAYQSLDVAGCWLDANQKMAELLGFDSPRQMTGLDFSTFVHDKSRDRFDATDDGSRTVRKVSELTLRRRDGQAVDVLIAGHIQRDAQGAFLRTHCVVVDISERRSMEQHILQLNTELETKVELRTAELAQANEELRRLIRRDALTGLANRMAANERLHNEFVSMKRSRNAYAVLLMDIDHFKRVNDSFGHAAGDQVLQQVAQALHAALRESDFVARWGGEEFLVLLPMTGLNQACQVAEKLRQVVERAQDPVVGGVTLSIGVATASPEHMSEDMAVRLADTRLYKAKNAGRNRVVAEAEL